MLVSKEMEEEKIVGVDMFIESAEQPEFIADKCRQQAGSKAIVVSDFEVYPNFLVFE